MESFTKLTMPDIDFYDVKESYAVDSSVTVQFSVSESFIVRPEDKIGLFHVGWLSGRDYVCTSKISQLADGRRLFSATLNDVRDMHLEDEDFYQFCYIHGGEQVLASSTPFQFITDDYEIINDADAEITATSESFIQSTESYENDHLKKSSIQSTQEDQQQQHISELTEKLKFTIEQLEDKCELCEELKTQVNTLSAQLSDANKLSAEQQLQLEAELCKFAELQAKCEAEQQKMSLINIQQEFNQGKLAELRAQLDAEKQTSVGLESKLEAELCNLAELQVQLDAEKQTSVGLESKLEAELCKLAESQAELDTERQTSLVLQSQLEAELSRTADLQRHLETERNKSDNLEMSLLALQNAHKLITQRHKRRDHVPQKSHDQTTACKTSGTDFSTGNVELLVDVNDLSSKTKTQPFLESVDDDELKNVQQLSDVTNADTKSSFEGKDSCQHSSFDNSKLFSTGETDLCYQYKRRQSDSDNSDDSSRSRDRVTSSDVEYQQLLEDCQSDTSEEPEYTAVQYKGPLAGWQPWMVVGSVPSPMLHTAVQIEMSMWSIPYEDFSVPDTLFTNPYANYVSSAWKRADMA